MISISFLFTNLLTQYSTPPRLVFLIPPQGIKGLIFRERRKHYESKPAEVKEILYGSSKKARETARTTLEETVDTMKIKF